MPSNITSSNRPRVLIVDDNGEVRRRSAAALERQCDVVGSVQDGSSAISSALSLQPDVVVLDISMPGMSGLEVASRLQQAGCQARVVFLTIHEEDDIVAAAQATGAVGYVIKPRLTADLLPAVLAALEGHPFVSPHGS